THHARENVDPDEVAEDVGRDGNGQPDYDVDRDAPPPVVPLNAVVRDEPEDEGCEDGPERVDHEGAPQFANDCLLLELPPMRIDEATARHEQREEGPERDDEAEFGPTRPWA